MHARILELQGKIRKLIPKGRSACNNICLGGGGVRKKTEILGGTKLLVGMEKNYFLSMLPLVGGSPYRRGILLLVGSMGYLRGNRAICRGTKGGFLFVRLHLSADKCDFCLPSLSLYFNVYFCAN